MLCSKILKKWLISFKCIKNIIQENKNQIIFDFMCMTFNKTIRINFPLDYILVETYNLK
jgi:NADPH-dependent 7-cyano-7-deazaguanine reductase QueF